MTDLVKDTLPLTEAYYYILVILFQRSSHGYGIMQDVEKMSNGRVIIGAGTLYTALNMLAKKGFIENVVDAHADKDSRRKMYRITDNGVSVLTAEINRLDELLKNGRRVVEGAQSTASNA